MTTMLAQVLHEFGTPSGFRLERVTRPVASPGRVLVRVDATSVNVADVKARALGHALDFVPSLPAVLGMDFAGVVAEVGRGVAGFAPGDRVFGCAGGVRGMPGALAEYIDADARLVAPAPTRIGATAAAALPLVGITAYEALVDRAGVRAGQHVLVHGGTGGVGHVGIQIAKALGARVSATAGGPDRLATARRLGADDVIDYREEPVQDYVDRLTAGAGFDVVFDTVGGDNLDVSLRAARLNGHVVTTVALQAYDLTTAHVRGLTLSVVYMLLPMLHARGRERHGEVLRDLARLVDEGRLTPLVDSTYPLAQAPAAHERVEGGGAVGKVVVQVAEG